MDPPSIGQFDGYFNINAQDLATVDPHGMGVFRTTSDLPRLFIEEQRAAILGIADVLRKEGNSVGVPLLHQPAQPGPHAFTILGPAEDRTIGVEWASHLRMSLDLIEEVKSFVAAQFPRWRVVMFGRNVDSRITIYANCIKFEPTVAGVTIAERLQAAMSREADEYNRTTGVEVRQHAYVRSQLASTPCELINLVTPEILFRFDNFCGDKSRSVLWIFHKLENAGDLEFGEGFRGINSAYAVSPEGELVGQYKLRNSAIGYLIETVFDAGTMQDELQVHASKSRWILKVPERSDDDI